MLSSIRSETSSNGGGPYNVLKDLAAMGRSFDYARVVAGQQFAAKPRSGAADVAPLLEDWRKEVESLAGAFARGEARVDPKRELQTCRYCDLQTLCRVYEKLNPLKEDESMEGADE